MIVYVITGRANSGKSKLAEILAQSHLPAYVLGSDTGTFCGTPTQTYGRVLLTRSVLDCVPRHYGTLVIEALCEVEYDLDVFREIAARFDLLIIVRSGTNGGRANYALPRPLMHAARSVIHVEPRIAKHHARESVPA